MSRFVALFAFACAISGSSAETLHDNDIDFPGAIKVEWRETAHAITTGQPYEGVSAHDGTLTVKAGRHESSGPADAFADGLDYDEHFMGLDAKTNSRPSKLNFVTFGSLTATFATGATKTCEDIRIGQGHEGSENNWWIASKGCFKAGGDQFVCEKCGMSFKKGQNDHEFVLQEEAAGSAGGKSHYGNPVTGCLSDEQPIEVHNNEATFCSKRCETTADCPTNSPSGDTAKPSCEMTPAGEKRCVLLCMPLLGECGRGRCESMQGTGVCTYEVATKLASSAVVV